MDFALTLLSLASFAALVLSWIALPHGETARETLVELKGAAQSA